MGYFIVQRCLSGARWEDIPDTQKVSETSCNLQMAELLPGRFGVALRVVKKSGKMPMAVRVPPAIKTETLAPPVALLSVQDEIDLAIARLDRECGRRVGFPRMADQELKTRWWRTAFGYRS
jgi:hypothetical protein